MSRRHRIQLTDEEQRELVESERVVVVSSVGPRGWPHSMPLWYVPRDSGIWIYTYAKSQKVKNLERDPRATLLIETGHEYGELRGLQIEAEADIHRDFDTVHRLARELAVRYSEGRSSVEGAEAAGRGVGAGPGRARDGEARALTGDAAEALEAQARKRVAVRFKPRRIASWDHRKLGGTY